MCAEWKASRLCMLSCAVHDHHPAGDCERLDDEDGTNTKPWHASWRSKNTNNSSEVFCEGFVSDGTAATS